MAVTAKSAQQDDKDLAEAQKLDAERAKLELEAQEIRLRLNARWWEGNKLPQYLLAIAISAAFLFGWSRTYLEPILQRHNEINELITKKNAVERELIEAESKLARQQRDDALSARTEALKDKERLEQEATTLKQQNIAAEQERDQLHATNARVTAELKKGKNFISILNGDDPINTLSSYGWRIWSDNRYEGLGYYLIITNPSVRSGKQFVVCRIFEVEETKQRSGEQWHRYIDEIVSRVGPIIALDYSYLGLFRYRDYPVGGILYAPGGQEIQFSARLSEWSKKLGELVND